MPNHQTNVAIRWKHRIEKMKLSQQKRNIKSQITTLECSYRKYSRAFAKFRNFNNKNWRKLINEEERFEGFKEFLNHQSEIFDAYTADLEEIMKTVNTPEQGEEMVPSTSNTGSSSSPEGIL